MTLQQGLWAAKRLVFHAYVAICLLSVVGGFLTAPLFTYCFFGDWRFWRHLGLSVRLFVHGWSFLLPLLRWENAGFMFSVPLTSPPASRPLPTLVRLNARWEHGHSCGNCRRCCEKIGCPILDKTTGLCRGYDAFFWRYFNCGRFPTVQPEIEYYGCPKWVMQPGVGARRPARRAVPVPADAMTAEAEAEAVRSG